MTWEGDGDALAVGLFVLKPLQVPVPAVAQGLGPQHEASVDALQSLTMISLFSAVSLSGLGTASKLHLLRGMLGGWSSG
eukprot:5603176-Amphidinium_carterae.1